MKEIEKRDSVLTPKQQIERLLRPGSTYFNLNPFEVLQIEPQTPLEDAKKKYKRLSILVHPDKNPDDPERAQLAFDGKFPYFFWTQLFLWSAVCKAWKTLDTPETRQKCLDIIEEATGRTDLMIIEKRRKLKKDGKSDRVEEDEPGKYKHAVYVMTMKLFADLERKKRDLEQRDMEERKRKREKEIEEEEAANTEKEWLKNFEVCYEYFI